MKIYSFFVGVIFVSWVILSFLYPEPSWWSIFSSDRSTHTPMVEQVSLVKVTIVAFIIAVPILLRRLGK
ncbi:hypothetical protein M3689_15305 [Alkalihalophilus marmarensis]|jgi:hypothetical protein|uniref:Uncharacterized protein n=1 Tax=Alkalihalophilus marmarensis DSM 21297 TaxID=1188261 RepID=U6SSE9_9BACI|nr:hypothetical protein [Alkalihalophilus marmarensis]ERN53815.1 hypothetical protein A33I_10065 [Alkalihalophilus marmarensis DSM 21297]MCM3490681.1 hypothetical protein [Alkalihalophilus marmarensis]